MDDTIVGGIAAASTGMTVPVMEKILYEVKKVVVGQDHFLERLLVALLANGHLLVEGVPGLAKTLTVKTLAETVKGSYKRIQFTPDLVPADLVGTRIYNQKTGAFSTSPGPVFTNLLLADEINRAPAKVQSALLEVMQEYQVTIAGRTYPVPRPFIVMATQNPIETEGTYALPEAQVDRFMMKILIDYPNDDEEFVIVERITGTVENICAVATAVERDEERGKSGIARASPLRPIRREPAGDDPPRRGRPGARLPAGQGLRPSAGPRRHGARRASAPPGALLRSDGRRRHARPDTAADHGENPGAGGPP
jgi:MoxR-like ATPase